MILENLSAADFQNGQVIAIDKETDWTSFDVVNLIRGLIRKKFQLKKLKVGHAGTLDPLATGLVIVCTGKATKKINEFMGMDKEYLAEINLGFTTPSYDLETESVEKFSTEHINEEQISEILKQKFTGEIEQVPPAYSAIKHKGQRAYTFARKGEDIKLAPKTIYINKIELLSCKLPVIKLRINCSKGTYIRSLARDIGYSINCGGTLVKLERKRIGNFILDDAILIEEFKKKLGYL